jgi:hypothetical protein
MIPKGVLEKIIRMSLKYLWVGHDASGGIHLFKWTEIVAPKDLGGWGLKDILPFSRALAGHNIWCLTQGNSLWSTMMNSKYFPNLSIEKWFRLPEKSSKGSIVWKALVYTFPLIGS